MEITIITLTNVSNISLRVQQFTERPIEIPEIPYKVFQYFNITTGIKSMDTNKALIEFKVDGAWIKKYK